MGLVETSKAPSKAECSSSSAGPFDVLPTMSRIGGVQGWKESECRRTAKFSAALVVAARMAYRGAPVFDNSGIAPVKKLEDRSRFFKITNKVETHPLVVAVWTEVSFPDVQSFSNKIFAVIGAFDVVRLREESVMNVP